MMNKKKLTIYERDIVVGALPNILTYNRDPYPFKGITKFFNKHKYITNLS